MLHQGDDGIHWRCAGSIPVLASGSPEDIRDLRRDLREHGLFFEAHPQLNRFPWAVPDITSNRSISAAIKRQTFNFHKKVLARPLGIFLDRLEARSGQDAWQRAAFCQTPQQVWDQGTYGLSGLDGISDRDATT